MSVVSAFQRPVFFLEQQTGLLAIRFYQRWLSPLKGFSCAYRVHTGHASCSALGYRAVRKYGMFAAIALIKERTYRCGVAYRRYGASHTLLKLQKGECDLGGCDIGGCDLPTMAACDAPCDSSNPIVKNSCDVMRVFGEGCSCDFLSNKKKEDDQYVYIPPNSKF
jgi:uncharacterized protein